MPRERTTSRFRAHFLVGWLVRRSLLSPQRDLDGGLAIRNVQFPPDLADVPPYRRFGDEELPRDLLRGKAFAQAVEDFPFAQRQIVGRPAYKPDPSQPGARGKFA